MRNYQISTILAAFMVLVMNILTTILRIRYNQWIGDTFPSVEPGNILLNGSDLIYIINLIVTFFIINRIYSTDDKILILYQNKIKIRVTLIFYSIFILLTVLILVFADVWINLAHNNPTAFLKSVVYAVVLESGDGDLILRTISSFNQPYQLKFYRVINILFNRVSTTLFYIFGMFSMFLWQKITREGSGETYPIFSIDHQ